MAEKKKRSPALRFFLGMLLYALLFGLLIVVGMRLFWGFIAEFEASRDNHAIEAYMDSMDEEHIGRLAEPFLSSLDAEIQNPAESRAAVDKVMQGDLRTVRQGAESNSNRAVFKIYSGERAIGRVVFTRPDNPTFGFSSWSLAEESFDFSWLRGADEITVPADWRVFVGGRLLNDDYIVERDIPYAYLKDFYGKGLPELYQISYRIDNYVGEAPFVLEDTFGRRVERSELSEDRFLDNCTEEEKTAQAAFINEFLPYYIECLANTNRNAQGNYNNIRRFLIADSDLDLRLRGAIAGQYYAHSQGETILSVAMDHHIHLGGEYYLVEFHYELSSKSQWEAEPTLSENHAQVILRLSDGKLRAQTIYSL